MSHDQKYEKKTASVGLIGLAVMGANLARNIASKGFSTCVYNRTLSVADDFIATYGNDLLFSSRDIKEFVYSLERPRKILILVKAGKPVDDVIEQVLPFLEQGDIVVDCGNSQFRDTQERYRRLTSQGFRFIGMGVSGGEEGALHGPSLMPGGDKETWEILRPIFQEIAARDFDGGSCVSYIGDNGAGHYVKMVHNGIEYAVMQLMAELYECFRSIFKLDASEIAKIFSHYNKGRLNSFLFEIAEKVLSKKDERTGLSLVDIILDRAGQKGTGIWTVFDALERGIPVPTICEAVFARAGSFQRESRLFLSSLYDRSVFSLDDVQEGFWDSSCRKPIENEVSRESFITLAEDACYAAMLSSYAQGYALIAQASDEEKWNIDFAEISRIWEGGCIIRAKILQYLHKEYTIQERNLSRRAHIFSLSNVVEDLKQFIPRLQKFVAFTAKRGVVAPAFASALHYFFLMTQQKSSANFIQGLRDYFGAHTYERVDIEGSFHTEWS